MSATYSKVQDSARKLSPEERARLAEELLESVRPPAADVDAAWAAEIERRLDALERGETTTIPAEEVFSLHVTTGEPTSPFDVPGIETDMSASDLVDAVRAARRR